jgi:NADPH-dependent ferric siderophore reductase
VYSVTTIRRTPLHTAIVTHAEALTPRMRRITLAVESLGPTRPAQDIELVLADTAGRKVKRRYTIRRQHSADERIDIDALLHGHGPGAQWAATVTPGDPVSFFGPRGRLTIPDVDWHLFVVDESALPALAAISEALPVGTSAQAVVEVDGSADEVALPGVEVRWLHRGDRPAGTSELLSDALAAITPPAGTGQGYLLGESRVIGALRPQLNAFGLPNDRLYVKGYWNVGRTGRPVPPERLGQPSS